MKTAAEGFSFGRLYIVPRLNDYAQLTKSRVTTLIIITAWCGFFFGARKAGLPVLSWSLLHALLGIGMVSSGTAALNEVMEHDVDSKMRRTARRPIPAGRMSLFHATVVGTLLTIGGSIYLVAFTNWLTGLLTFLTSVIYLLAYTPLKRISPICTFVGAFPGAMPGVLGWTAARGHMDWGTLALFAILFLWQFPHFFAIAWMYREDYAKGSIRMLPVVEPDGRSTTLRILLYSLALHSGKPHSGISRHGRTDLSIRSNTPRLGISILWRAPDVCRPCRDRFPLQNSCSPTIPVLHRVSSAVIRSNDG